MEDEIPSPAQVAAGRLSSIPDSELSAIAAEWLATDYDSEPLREVAGLSRSQGAEARERFPEVLASLGHRVRDHSPSDDSPWRGHWARIDWARRQIEEGTYTPYASAQVVLEVLDDAPDLWVPGGGDKLQALLREWDAAPAGRDELNAALVAHLDGLSESDVQAARSSE